MDRNSFHTVLIIELEPATPWLSPQALETNGSLGSFAGEIESPTADGISRVPAGRTNDPESSSAYLLSHPLIARPGQKPGELGPIRGL